MSTKPLMFVLVFAGAAVAAAQGCGGGGGGGSAADFRALCDKNCDKAAMCSGFPELAAFCKAACAQAGTDGGTGERCANESAIISKVNECLAKPCPEYETCSDMIPECQTTGGGTGGRSSGGGTGGSSGGGTGGATAAAGCEACVKADACCAAALGPASCTGTYASSCGMVEASVRPSLVGACATLTAAFPNVPACM